MNSFAARMPCAHDKCTVATSCTTKHGTVWTRTCKPCVDQVAHFAQVEEVPDWLCTACPTALRKKEKAAGSPVKSSVPKKVMEILGPLLSSKSRTLRASKPAVGSMVPPSPTQTAALGNKVRSVPDTHIGDQGFASLCVRHGCAGWLQDQAMRAWHVTWVESLTEPLHTIIWMHSMESTHLPSDPQCQA